MDPSDHLLSFVTSEDGTMVSVHLDLEGVKLLLKKLTGIREKLEENDCPHTHLFGYNPWDELTQTMLQNQPSENTTVGHVKIYGWNEEWAVRHGLKPSTDPAKD